ncbi:DoxX family membrane protein [Spongiibacter sp. KMU-166]|uniref:DoxX family membrane protein n=1 Tax=Spongiibacter thalassae TaxID=2721624 RepID=A0ABX1GAJ2_9GAMM|nr:DoxX family protein [Spongiibacter thalassae]NKI15946.1 DoxX family membrane protein [Spongiibacter thalassae]
MSYLIYIALMLFGVFFTGAAILKLTRHQHFIEEFESMKVPYSLAYLSGAIEIVCGPLLIAGIWFPAYAGVASGVMFFAMLGASATNLVSVGRGAKVAIGVLAIFALPMLLVTLYFLEPARLLVGI